MRGWLVMLAGLLIWAAHFLGIYIIASIADVVATADDPAWRWGGVAFSLACALAALAVTATTARALRRRSEDEARIGDLSGFILSVGALGGAVALVSIAWQTLPNLIGY